MEDCNCRCRCLLWELSLTPTDCHEIKEGLKLHWPALKSIILIQMSNWSTARWCHISWRHCQLKMVGLAVTYCQIRCETPTSVKSDLYSWQIGIVIIQTFFWGRNNLIGCATPQWAGTKRMFTHRKLVNWRLWRRNWISVTILTKKNYSIGRLFRLLKTTYFMFSVKAGTVTFSYCVSKY